MDGWTDGRTVTISAWAKGSQNLSKAFEFFIERHYLQCLPHRFGHQAVTTEWQRYTVTHTLSAAHTEICDPFLREVDANMRVGVGRAYWETDTATVWFDDFQVEVGNSTTSFTDKPWEEGKIGKALEFDGINDYVTIPISNSLRPNTSLTLEAWVKPKTPWTGDIIILGQSAYYLTVESDLSVQVYWYGKTPPGYHSTGPNTATPNEWNHVVASWDSSKLRIYVNGNQKLAADVGGTGSPAENQVWLGAEYNGTTRNFSGLADEIRIYNHPYKPEELYTMKRA